MIRILQTVVLVVSDGRTEPNRCRALPGTILQTGNYHFNAGSICGPVVCGGGTPNTETGRKAGSGGEKRAKHDARRTKARRGRSAARSELHTMDVSGPEQRK